MLFITVTHIRKKQINGFINAALQGESRRSEFPKVGAALLFDVYMHTVHTSGYFGNGVECWVERAFKTILDRSAK